MKLKYIKIILALFIATSLSAQNKGFDWGFGVQPSIYSFSAIKDSKVMAPYSYNRGIAFSLSRYINNSVDFSLEGGRSANVLYPIDYNDRGEWIYRKSSFFDAQFVAKYKFDNGYILKEHFPFAPYIKAGFGANRVTIDPTVRYHFPLSLGFNINISNRFSVNYEATYKYIASNPREYMQHNVGIRYNFGEASRKRLLATRRREAERRAELIAKRRAERHNTTTVAMHDPVTDKESNTKTGNKSSDVSTEIPGPVDRLELDSEPEAITASYDVPTVELGESLPPLPTFSSKESDSSTKRTSPIKSTPPPPPPAPKEELIIDEVIEIETTEEEITFGSTQEITTPEPTAIVIQETDDYCVQSAASLSEIGKNITFDSDQHRVRSRTYGYLSEVADVMNRCEGMSYVIIAHADSDGNSDYNRRLSLKRAQAIKAHLTAKGIASSRLIADAYGDYAPIVENTSEVNKAKNRRVEFKINYTITQ